MKNSRPKPVDIHVSKRVRERRLSLGLTQIDMGKALGVSFQQIQKYESGTNRISASKLHMLAQALQVAPGYFFEGLEQKQAPDAADLTQALLASSDALALVGSFQRISNRTLRRMIIALVEELAEREQNGASRRRDKP